MADPARSPQRTRRGGHMDLGCRQRGMYPGSIHPKPPFWGRYRVDIYPDLGRPSGIFDANASPMTFAEAFRQQRVTYRRKGIVRLRRDQ